MLRRLVVACLLLGWTIPATAAEKSRDQVLAELFALIDRADEMVVYSEGFRREFVVYRSTKRRDFDELKSAITLKGNGGGSCACVDGPEIALLKNKKEIAAVWNHEGTAIGSSVWQGEWENGDPDRWLRWFDVRGMKDAREFFQQLHLQARRERDAEQRWLKAMPSSLKPLWPKVLRGYDPSIGRLDLQPLDAALAKQYPDREERIRALMAWFGSGEGPWSGFPGYEEIAEKLLRQYPTVDLIKAVENRDLTERELEGAARILGGWTPDPDPTPIPADLRQTLLAHCLKSTDRDKVDRARHAFGPGK